MTTLTEALHFSEAILRACGDQQIPCGWKISVEIPPEDFEGLVKSVGLSTNHNNLRLLSYEIDRVRFIPKGMDEANFQKQSRISNLAQQLFANQADSVICATNQDYQNHIRQKWGNDPFIGGQQMHGNREWYNDAGTGTMQNQASQFINNPAPPYVAITAFKAALPDPSIFGIEVKPEESESDRIARVTQSMCK